MTDSDEKIIELLEQILKELQTSRKISMMEAEDALAFLRKMELRNG